MNNEGEEKLSDRERTLIAMGAAMGAGCRKCAERLHSIGMSIKIPAGDAWKAFEMGINAKAEAINTMRAVVSSLFKDETDSSEKCNCDNPIAADLKKNRKMACLIRMASYAAANSAPDVLSEMGEAAAQGISRREIDLCLGIAKMVREKAAAFSDREAGETREVRESVDGQQVSECAATTCNAGCSCDCN